ncbi:MAG TPA: Si-specific NAD(P)(+) transhydrogenase [Steroidobacteraceae bacterium]|nr:Si-specific NAD(P)(+) transhydrogenase [Steroidobacteraceae bacterium]
MSFSTGVSAHYDVVVIGSGPAGQKAAIQAAKAGKKVAVIERDRRVGGSCVHTGTIPSKSLREHALRQRVRRVDLMDEPIQSLLDGVGVTVAAHDAYMSAQLERNHVELLRGRASFNVPHELAMTRIDGSQITIRAPIIIIATGSRPRSPAHLAVDHEHVLDSDSILSLAYLPRSLLVLGGGVIGSEYAATFAALGCKVTQADQFDQPLAFLDPELTSFYLEELRKNGGEYIPAATAISTRWDGVSQVRTEFKDGRVHLSDKVLVALGRLANVDGLKLDAAGIALTSRGHVQVDENLQTTAAGVYAAGDVIGPPALASVSMEQGRRAACHALGLLVRPESVSTLPSGVYTIPEIATVGLDEHGARRQFGGAIVGRARFEEIARGQINGSQRGLLKLIADPGGRRVVGVQIAGDGATELVHIGQLGLAAELDVDAYVDNVFNFPTMAEAYRIAAFDIVKQRGRSTTSDTVADAVSAVL